MIRSTDSDVLFTALLNYDKLNLEEKQVYIHYSKVGEATKYCSVNKLVKLISEDPSFSLLKARDLPISIFVGLLHFISGCDDLSFLRGFTKRFCFKAFLRYNELICPESPEAVCKIVDGNEMEVLELLVAKLANNM